MAPTTVGAHGGYSLAENNENGFSLDEAEGYGVLFNAYLRLSLNALYKVWFHLVWKILKAIPTSFRLRF